MDADEFGEGCNLHALDGTRMNARHRVQNSTRVFLIPCSDASRPRRSRARRLVQQSQKRAAGRAGGVSFDADLVMLIRAVGCGAGLSNARGRR